jgi:hypothetical protein
VGNKSQKVAAWLAGWATRQAPGTIAKLPEVTDQNGLPSGNNHGLGQARPGQGRTLRRF